MGAFAGLQETTARACHFAKSLGALYGRSHSDNVCHAPCVIRGVYVAGLFLLVGMEGWLHRRVALRIIPSNHHHQRSQQAVSHAQVAAAQQHGLAGGACRSDEQLTLASSSMGKGLAERGHAAAGGGGALALWGSGGSGAGCSRQRLTAGRGKGCIRSLPNMLINPSEGQQAVANGGVRSEGFFATVKCCGGGLVWGCRVCSATRKFDGICNV